MPLIPRALNIMEVPTEDEAAAAEKAPVKKTATVASGGKKAPVENLVTGEKAVASEKGASVENVAAVAPSGRKAPSGKKALCTECCCRRKGC